MVIEIAIICSAIAIIFITVSIYLLSRGISTNAESIIMLNSRITALENEDIVRTIRLGE